MQTLIEIKKILLKRLLAQAEENKEALLEDARGETFNTDVLDKFLEQGEQLASISRTIREIEESTEIMVSFPSNMLQAIASIQRDDGAAPRILARLYEVSDETGSVMANQLLEKWRTDIHTPLKCVGLDMALFSAPNDNDALNFIQDLFGVGGDIALAYMTKARSP
jgi:hypothetical protein